MYCRLSWTTSIVQAWSATKHMIISVVHTPPMPPPWMDYGNYPMSGNLYMIWYFDLPIFVVNYVSPQLIKKNLSIFGRARTRTWIAGFRDWRFINELFNDDRGLKFVAVNICNICIKNVRNAWSHKDNNCSILRRATHCYYLLKTPLKNQNGCAIYLDLRSFYLRKSKE